MRPNNAAAAAASEKQKWDAKEKKMTETICHRDGCIMELERQCAQHVHEMTQLAARWDIMFIGLVALTGRGFAAYWLRQL